MMEKVPSCYWNSLVRCFQLDEAHLGERLHTLKYFIGKMHFIITKIKKINSNSLQKKKQFCHKFPNIFY
jgi:hypothetical protein